MGSILYDNQTLCTALHSLRNARPTVQTEQATILFQRSWGGSIFSPAVMKVCLSPALSIPGKIEDRYFDTLCIKITVFVWR